MCYLILYMYTAAVRVKRRKREKVRDLARRSASEAGTEATPTGFPDPGWSSL